VVLLWVAGGEEALHRFQQDSGVAMSRGDRRCMYVAPAGVDMSLVWLQTFRRAQRDYKAATFSRCSAAGLRQMRAVRATRATKGSSAHAPRETAGLSFPK
jgi:hypothetical protein